MGEIKQGYSRVFTLLLTINYATGKVALTTVQAPIIAAELLTGVKVCLFILFFTQKKKAELGSCSFVFLSNLLQEMLQGAQLRWKLSLLRPGRLSRWSSPPQQWLGPTVGREKKKSIQDQEGTHSITSEE